MWIEIVMLFLLAPLLEILITVIVENVRIKKKWSPYEKACNEATHNATKDKFVLMLNKDIKAVVLLGIISFSFFALLGVILYPAIYINGKMGLVELILASIVYNIICMPILFLMIKSFYRKVFIDADIITVKSLLTVKKVKFDEINKVISKTYLNQNSDYIIIYVKSKKFLKVTRSSINYDLAEGLFSELCVYQKIKIN